VTRYARYVLHTPVLFELVMREILDEPQDLAPVDGSKFCTDAHLPQVRTLNILLGQQGCKDDLGLYPGA
jgi:hypothetical protein